MRLFSTIELNYWVSALAAAREPLAPFLGEWPGVPIADYQGVVISKALGSKKAIILAHHAYLTAARTIEQATYLPVYLERAVRSQIRARVFGPLTPIDDALAKEARDYLLQPSIVKSTFDYWCRQTYGASPPLALE